MIPAIEAISDICDKAVEEGKPIYITPGDKTLIEGREAVWAVAGMNVTRYTTTLAVRKGARPVLIPVSATVLPLIDGVFKEVCVKEGKPEAYKNEDVIYRGAYVMATIEHMAANGVSGLISVGGLSGGAHTPVAVAAKDLGGLLVAGTPRFLHQGTFALLSDFPVFMDDVFAASAVCSGDNVVKSTMIASDYLKFSLVGVIFISILAVILGLPVDKWLKM